MHTTLEQVAAQRLTHQPEMDLKGALQASCTEQWPDVTQACVLDSVNGVIEHVHYTACGSCVINIRYSLTAMVLDECGH